MKYRIGDRVAIYDCYYVTDNAMVPIRLVGTVGFVGHQVLGIKLDRPFLKPGSDPAEFNGNYCFAHVKECRKLVKKAGKVRR